MPVSFFIELNYSVCSKKTIYKIEKRSEIIFWILELFKCSMKNALFFNVKDIRKRVKKIQKKWKKYSVFSNINIKKIELYKKCLKWIFIHIMDERNAYMRKSISKNFLDFLLTCKNNSFSIELSIKNIALINNRWDEGSKIRWPNNFIHAG